MCERVEGRLEGVMSAGAEELNFTVHLSTVCVRCVAKLQGQD